MLKSERLIRLTKRLLDRPAYALSLTDLAVELGAAKSSLSEDAALIRQVFTDTGTGDVETVQGASGGVRYRVAVPDAVRQTFLDNIQSRLADASRILPGGFLYMSDILGDPDVLDLSGRIFAESFRDSGANVVVTVETKGIPLAVSTARYLHVPVVVVRREHKVTDGAALSVHYVSGSERRIQTMAISTRAMPENARALVVDDFMRAGATMKAVVNLLTEFSAEVVGTAVFMATTEPSEKLISAYRTLFKVGSVSEGQPPVVTVADMVHEWNGCAANVWSPEFL